MGFDYRNHYKRLISDLTNLLAKSIEQIPEGDKDTPPDELTPEKELYYKRKGKKQEPLRLD